MQPSNEPAAVRLSKAQFPRPDLWRRGREAGIVAAMRTRALLAAISVGLLPVFPAVFPAVADTPTLRWDGLAGPPPLDHHAPRPGAAATLGRRCTADRALCIRQAAYIPDVCRAVEALARDNALDREVFARLLWKESLFDAAAVSPAGAQGIAQFMPETARRRGLADAFNPAEAMAASARYLADLSRDYGNIGLAAAAYNGGEARVDRFLAAKERLPAETRAYVEAVTGVPVEAWRDAPPDAADLALASKGSFQQDCVARAAKRTYASPEKPLPPWGVVVASNRSSDGAERQVARLRNRHGALLRAEAVRYTRGRMPGNAAAPGLRADRPRQPRRRRRPLPAAAGRRRRLPGPQELTPRGFRFPPVVADPTTTAGP